MQAKCEVGRAVCKNSVVDADILVEELLGVNPRLLHTVDRRICAEEGEGWVVELHVATAKIVQLDQLFAICLDEILEVGVLGLAGQQLDGSAWQTGAYHH